MKDSLMNCKNLEECISNHHQKCKTQKKKLKRKIFKNLEYKKDLYNYNMFEESEYSFEIIKKTFLKMERIMHEYWKIRFSFNPKEAFNKLEVVTKYKNH